jgi:cytochrome P450
LETQNYIKGRFFFGKSLEFKKDALGFFQKCANTYPNYQRFKFAHLNMLSISSPDYIDYVLRKNNKNYKKGIEYDHLKPTLGNGLLTNEGEHWLKQRRLAQPAFHKKTIVNFEDTIKRISLDFLDRVPSKKMDVHPWFMEMTVEIISQLMFSTTVKENTKLIGESLEVAIAESYRRLQMLIPSPLWLPTPKNIQYNKARSKLKGLVKEIISERESKKEKKGDLLQMLIDARYDDGSAMDEKQLVDEVMTIFLAGHETTANALSWALYLLGKNERIQDEVREKLSDGESLDNLINEVLRLYPPAWGIGRTALENDSYKDMEVQKSDNIVVCIYALHRNPEYWENENEFIPDRWNEPDILKNKNQFIPFGLGPRFCIGNNFALMEMKIILKEILSRHKVSIEKNFESTPLPLITLRPEKGVEVEFK